MAAEVRNGAYAIFDGGDTAVKSRSAELSIKAVGQFISDIRFSLKNINLQYDVRVTA